MMSANASAMRCVVNGVKMTMMRDVARRLTRGKRQRDEMENGEDDDDACVGKHDTPTSSAVSPRPVSRVHSYLSYM